MSIKKYAINALGAFATVAALTACSNAPTPDEKESEAAFGPYFDKGLPNQAIGRYIPFGPNDSKGVLYVSELLSNDNGSKLCLRYLVFSRILNETTQFNLTYCRPVTKIETGPATTPKAQL